MGWMNFALTHPRMRAATRQCLPLLCRTQTLKRNVSKADPTDMRHKTGCGITSVESLARSLRYFLRPRLPSYGIASSPFASFSTEAKVHRGERCRTEPTNFRAFISSWKGELIAEPMRWVRRRVLSDEILGRLYGGVGKFKDTTGRLDTCSPLPFLLEPSAPAKALAFRFSSRTPVAARQIPPQFRRRELPITPEASPFSLIPRCQRTASRLGHEAKAWKAPCPNSPAAHSTKSCT